MEESADETLGVKAAISPTSVGSPPRTRACLEMVQEEEEEAAGEDGGHAERGVPELSQWESTREKEEDRCWWQTGSFQWCWCVSKWILVRGRGQRRSAGVETTRRLVDDRTEGAQQKWNLCWLRNRITAGEVDARACRGRGCWPVTRLLRHV